MATPSIAILLLFIILPLNISGQEKLKGNKIVVTEDRNISDFNKIEINDNIDVIITQRSDKSVSVETDENLQFAVLTEVKGEVLTIKLSKKIIKKKVLKVYISIDDFIDEINTYNRADVRSDGTLNLDQIVINAEDDSKVVMDIKCALFSLKNNESANVNLTVKADKAIINSNKTGRARINIDAENIEVLCQGNSTTELVGNSVDFMVNAENKSNLKASMLECNDVTVNASDNSDIHINAKNSVIISLINSAEVYLYNDPEITIEKFADKAILRKK
jgi:hypothetical protein